MKVKHFIFAIGPDEILDYFAMPVPRRKGEDWHPTNESLTEFIARGNVSVHFATRNENVISVFYT